MKNERYIRKFEEGMIKKVFKELYIIPGFREIKVKMFDRVFKIDMNGSFEERESFYNLLKKYSQKEDIMKDSTFNSVKYTTSISDRVLSDSLKKFSQRNEYDKLYFKIFFPDYFQGMNRYKYVDVQAAIDSYLKKI